MINYKQYEDLKKRREKLQKSIQQDFDNSLTYREKLIVIYKKLMISQVRFQIYKNNYKFSEQDLMTLLNKLDLIENINDIKFYNFLNNELIKPLDSGHVDLKFENEYSNALIEIYRLLETKSKDNKKIISFLQTHSLDYLIEKLNERDDIDEQKFEDFLLNNSIFDLISKEELFKSKTEKDENLSITYLDDETVLISLKSFSRKYLENDKAKFKTMNYELENSNYKNIIIDIRGNGGGSDEYFQYFKSINNKEISSEKKYYNLFSDIIEICDGKTIEKGTDKEYSIYLLVDSKVFSTAEHFTDLCKQSGFATVIGEKTLGEGYGIDPISIKLGNENSFILRFPVEAPINEIGEIDYENCYCTVPDIECKSNEVLDITMNLIAEKKQNVNI